MRKIFFIGLIGLALFEILNVYFIMPMPGSQRMNSIDVAYFLHQYRWYFRIGLGLMIVVGSLTVFNSGKRWVAAASLILLLAVVYVFNFRMTAERMFLQPEQIAFAPRAQKTIGDSTLVIAVAINGEAKAYPIRYIQYHHQVRDTLAGQPIMVTYCNVCRTGRVFEPLVQGKAEQFRLVGMDHFNAMFEDHTTHSWWRQSTGEAVTGPLKGTALPEVESTQMTVGKFFFQYPFGLVMQPEQRSRTYYDTLGRFEKGLSKSKLTGTDSLSWKDKSWVVGVSLGNKAKAYDWNELKAKRVINDEVDGKPVVIALADDRQSFAAFERTTAEQKFILRNDSLIADHAFDFAGHAADGSTLKTVKAYQEFWHSWKTFHPDTEIYKAPE